MEDMALVEKRRRKERENWWKKILAYYMMQKIMDEQKRQELIRAYALHNTLIINEHIVMRQGLLALLFRKTPGTMSAFEILRKIAPMEADNSPFKMLLGKISQEPMSEEETEKAIAEVIEKAPPMLLEDARQERERRDAWEQEQEAERQARLRQPAARPEMPKQDEKAIHYEEQLRLKLAFLRQLMPPELFQELCQGLAREGHEVNVNELDIPDYPQPQITYQSYVAQKQAQLRMHNGKYVHEDNVYTSAAYMLAAYEQKDAPRFDAQLADNRAREIFGSKAFRVYLDSHPGSLVAASQNMFMDITYEGMITLENELNKRDTILSAVNRNLRAGATGQTAGYFQMMNKLDRFVKSFVEPSDAERKELIASLGNYVLKDCAPGSKVGNENAMKDALCAIKALVPADSFAKLMDKVNEGRSQKLDAKEFEKPREVAEPVAERANAMAEMELSAIFE